MKFKSYAKVNLWLRIIKKLRNGYHYINSLVIFCDIHDNIKIEKDKSLSITFSGSFGKYLNSKKDSLIQETIESLSSHLGTDCSRFRIDIEKNIPISSGLGGGSANAATLVRGLLKITGKEKIYDSKSDFSDKKKKQELIKILTNLGSDIPVCFFEKSSVVTGIGNVINPVNKLPEFWLVLLNSGKPLSTKAVYDNLIFNKNRGIGLKSKLSIDFSDNVQTFFSQINEEYHQNDLLPSAIRQIPEIQEALNLLSNDKKSKKVGMSGSGATCYALFSEENEAQRCADHALKTLKGWWIKKTKILP